MAQEIEVNTHELEVVICALSFLTKHLENTQDRVFLETNQPYLTAKRLCNDYTIIYAKSK